MTELLILEMDDVDESVYAKANAALELDPATGAGEWPAGLISHIAGVSPATGRGYVVEIWESQEAQHEFMSTRLGAAMAKAGIDSQPTVTWARVMGQYHPG